MPRYKLTVEYDGRPFAGWQIQADQLTVQGLLTSAVEALSGDKTLVQGAGRTDAGVHARAQIAHVDLTKEWDTDTIRDALNAHLRPHPIAILAAERAADDFNARTSAIRRHYLYRIINRRADLTLEAGRAWRVPRPLDAATMHAGGTAPGRKARFHDVSLDRMPGQVAGENARYSQGRARRRGRLCDRGRTLVPAQSGTLDGRLTRPGRRRQMEPPTTSRKHSTLAIARPAALSRRRTGCT